MTTYGLARRQSWLEKMRWSLVVLDEAQAIKNSGSTQTRAVKKLQAPCRLVLTGTPAGVGMGRGRFLKPADAVRLWIETIGELNHTLA